MSRDIWAVVPIKELGGAKQGLARLLDACLRRDFARAMFGEVLVARAGAAGAAAICERGVGGGHQADGHPDAGNWHGCRPAHRYRGAPPVAAIRRHAHARLPRSGRRAASARGARCFLSYEATTRLRGGVNTTGASSAAPYETARRSAATGW